MLAHECKWSHRSINGACHYACRRLGRRFSRLALLQSHARDHGHTHSWHAHPELIPAFLVWIVAWCESCGDDQWSSGPLMLLSIFSLLLHLSDPHTPMPGTMPMPGKPAMQCKSMQKLSVTLDTQPKPRTVPFQHQYDEWILIVPSSFASMLANKAGAPIPAMPAHGAHAHHVVAISRHHHARHCCHHAHASMHSRLK